MEIEQKKQTGGLGPTTKCFGLARIGFKDQLVRAAQMKDFLEIDMGPPLHSFVICAENIHSMEQEMYDHFSK